MESSVGALSTVTVGTGERLGVAGLDSSSDGEGDLAALILASLAALLNLGFSTTGSGSSTTGLMSLTGAGRVSRLTGGCFGCGTILCLRVVSAISLAFTAVCKT